MLTFVRFKSCLTNAVLATRLQLFSGTPSNCAKYKNVIRTFGIGNGRSAKTGLLHYELPKFKFLQNTIKRRLETNALDINTNVQNNVILFKHEKNKMKRILMFFIPAQLFCVCSTVYASFSPQLFTEFYLPFPMYKKKHGVNAMLFFCAVVIGGGLISVGWVYLARSVTYLILHKGGKTVTMVTNHPIKSRRILTYPVDFVRNDFSK